ATPGEREESKVKRIRLGVAGTGMLVLVLGAVVFAGSSSSRSANTAAALHEDADGLVSASAVSADRQAGARTARSATSFGPNVINGRVDGVSPPVSSLPVITALPVTSVTARDNEELQPAGQSNAKDPVIQKSKGTGPISA